jgi:hypothetical protein
MFLGMFSKFWRLIYVLVLHVFGDALHVLEINLCTCTQTSSSNAAVHSEVNNLVTGAIAAAHAGISGEPQLLPTIISPSTASSVEPTRLFHSAGLAIDSRVSAKLKGKIWNEEFIDFGSLLSNSANGNDINFHF